MWHISRWYWNKNTFDSKNGHYEWYAGKIFVDQYWNIICISVIFSQVHLHCDSHSDAIDFVCKAVNQLAHMAHRIRISKECLAQSSWSSLLIYVLEKSNTLASQANSTDLFWTERMETLTEVWTDDRESCEVALHGHILTALREQLLKHTCVETEILQACQLKIIFCISKLYALF